VIMALNEKSEAIALDYSRNASLFAGLWAGNLMVYPIDQVG
jgi:hypothetical protein